jgi:NAD(P)H dehydrogenase (quinone)
MTTSGRAPTTRAIGRVAITGAAGKTGRAVVAAAVARGLEVRALVHRDDQVALARQAGASDVQVGDQREVTTVTALLRGTDAVYAIAPNLHPDEVGMGRALVAGARRAGVGRVVYHSVINPQLTAMPHHADKLRVEELLLESRLPVTILRPNAYHDNVLGHLEAIRATGVWEVPYDPFARSASIALVDVAEVAATVLAEPGHEYAAHDLSGPRPVAPADVARVLSEVLGRVVLARRGDPEAMASGVSPMSRDRLRAMFACYDAMGSPGSPITATALLGRPPTTFRDWARQVIA